MKILISMTIKDGKVIERIYAEIPAEEVAKKWGLIQE